MVTLQSKLTVRRDSSEKALVVIEAGALSKGYWAELGRFRGLFYTFALRDILVRYKQTALGVMWSVLRPLATMAILTWVFSRGAQLTTPDPSIPYTLWVFVGTLPWQFFSDGVIASSNSMVTNAEMVSKVYFPRVILPVSRVVVSFIDFAISFVVLIGMIILYHFSKYEFTPSWRMIFVPVFLLIAFAFTVGVGLLFSAVNVRYRDFAYVIPFLVTFGIYASPVGIGSAELTQNNPLVRNLYSLNPMASVIDGFRWCTFGTRAPLFWSGQLISIAVVAVGLLVGYRYFRYSERTFADVI